MSRSQRLFDLLSVLRTRGRTTVAELADDLQVSTRTVHRDLASLAEIGVPVVTEPGRYGGVSVLPGGRFQVAGLSAREKDLLRITGLDAGRAAELGHEALARSAVGKLGETDCGRVAVLPLSQVVTVDNRPWFSGVRPSIDVAALAEDIRTGHRLSITYRRSGEDAAEERLVDPYGLLGQGGRWYLVADRDGAPRQYAVERLATWTVVDAPRRLRPGVTLDSVVEQLARDLERPRESVVITAELHRGRLDIARRILGSRLIAVEDSADADTVTISVEYTEIGGVRQLLQFGDSLEVTAPEEARRLVVDLSRAILSRYERN
ncbi:helix-turn-helix transcriptional regulator [Corynebacterium variabile]|uniref:helix-turn-helix transcriptional regulator n=1 Tax=Corynebacterium variabile TaxID=1727 RepID=UPI003BB060C5